MKVNVGFKSNDNKFNVGFESNDNKFGVNFDSLQMAYSGVAVSPTIDVEEITGGNRLIIEDIEGVKTVDIMDGKDGANGKDGVNGKDGADGYTPVKGVDYYTDAEKAEIVAAVVASLPVYNGEVATV